MNLAVIRERAPFDRRVALTPPVVRRLCGAGHTVCPFDFDPATVAATLEKPVEGPVLLKALRQVLKPPAPRAGGAGFTFDGEAV